MTDNLINRLNAANIGLSEFTGENFIKWRTQLKRHLQVFGVKNYLEHEPAKNNQIEEKEDLLAYELVLANLSKEIKYRFDKEDQTTCKLFKALNNRYLHVDGNTQKFLVNELVTIESSSFNSVDDYVDRFLDIVQELQQIDKPFTSDQNKIFFFKGLANQYETFENAMSEKDFDTTIQNYPKYLRKDRDLMSNSITARNQRYNRHNNYSQRSNNNYNQRSNNCDYDKRSNKYNNDRRSGSGHRSKSNHRSNSNHRPNSNHRSNSNRRSNKHKSRREGHRRRDYSSSSENKSRSPSQDRRRYTKSPYRVVCDSICNSLHKSAANRDDWQIDGGSNVSICNDRTQFQSLKPVNETLGWCGSAVLKIKGRGDVVVRLKSGVELLIPDVALVEEFKHNIFACNLMKKFNYKQENDDGYIECRQTKKRIYISKRRPDHTFYLNLPEKQVTFENPTMKINNSIRNTMNTPKNKCSTIEQNASDLDVEQTDDDKLKRIDFIEYHCSNGHPSDKALSYIARREKVKVYGIQPCISCKESKFTVNINHQSSETSATRPLDILHTDLCGPFSETDRSQFQYFMLIVDEFSHHYDTIMLKKKSQAQQKLINYIKYVCNQTGLSVCKVRSDNGKEYVNELFDTYCESNGIEHQRSCPNSQWQNGKSERGVRTIEEKSMCLRKDACIDRVFGDSVCYAAYLHNLTPSRVIGWKTPNDLWPIKSLNLKPLVFGCFVAYSSFNSKKGSDRGIIGRFAGFPAKQKGYKVLNESTGKITVTPTIDVLTDCNGNSICSHNIDKVPNLINKYRQSIKSKQQPTILKRKSTVDQRPTNTTNNKIIPTDQRKSTTENNRKSTEKNEQSSKVIIPINLNPELNQIRIPNTYKQAMDDPVYSDLWSRAMDEEYESLILHNTWKTVHRNELPDGQKILPLKWSYSVQEISKDLVRFKARAVCGGHKQIPGVDFDESFAPTLSIRNFRMLLMLAVKYNLVIKTLDVKTAFLNSHLHESVYTNQLPGYEIAMDLIYQLERSLYGLRQSNANWYAELRKVLYRLNFVQNDYDPSIWMHKEIPFFWLAVYVDDFLAICETERKIDELVVRLNDVFKLKENGVISRFLGIDVVKHLDRLYINQTSKIVQLAEQFDCIQHSEKRLVPMPSKTLLKLNPRGKKMDDQKLYQSLVGSLLHICVTTRPDISFPVVQVCRFMSTPQTSHYRYALNILRYMYNTRNMSIEFDPQWEMDLSVYSDSDFANDADRLSYSGYAVMLNNTCIAWSSKKQPIVCHGPDESEIVAADLAAREVMYTKHVLSQMNIDLEPTLIVDNQNCILVSDRGYGERTKHLHVRFLYVHKLCESGLLKVVHVDTKLNTADCLTKNLPTGLFKDCRDGFGLVELEQN